MSLKKSVRDVEVSGQKILVRVDFNVPFSPGTLEIANTKRITASIPTLQYLLDNDAAIIICSHLGRPKGREVSGLSLRPIWDKLNQMLGLESEFCPSLDFPEISAAAQRVNSGEVLLLENLRFHAGEESNDPRFAQNLASLADIYVNDAFGAAHRNHASVQGITNYIPSVAGLLLEKEILSLQSVLTTPKRPFTAVLGGAKVSDKINVVRNLMTVADNILIGGGMAATFLVAESVFVGDSQVEESFIDSAKQLMKESRALDCEIVLPTDAVVSKCFGPDSSNRICDVSDIHDGEILLDVGPSTSILFKDVLSATASALWNGPMGVYEWPQYSKGTKTVAESLSRENITSVIGGGSTVDAVSSLGLEARMNHVSTGGGASLEFLEGRDLPGIASLIDI